MNSKIRGVRIAGIASAVPAEARYAVSQVRSRIPRGPLPAVAAQDEAAYRAATERSGFGPGDRYVTVFAKSCTKPPLQTAGPAGISPEEAQKIANMTGVHKRHVASSSCCTSDMACAATRRLLEDLNWERESI